MDLVRDIETAKVSVTGLLFSAVQQGQVRAAALRQQSEDNAVASVDRLGRELLASRRREAALVRRVAELEAALRSERSRPRGMDWGQGLRRA